MYTMLCTYGGLGVALAMGAYAHKGYLSLIRPSLDPDTQAYIDLAVLGVYIPAAVIAITVAREGDAFDNWNRVVSDQMERDPHFALAVR